MIKRNKVKLILLGLGAMFFVLQFSTCSLQSNQETGQQNNTTAVNTQKATVSSVGRLTGVNWFGFETGNFCPHGLWSRDYKSMLKQIKDLGFNCIRMPWCNDMLSATPNSIQINASGVDAYTGQTGLNMDLAGLSSIQVMDKVIDEATRVDGIKIILDNHSKTHDNYNNETLWYTSSCSESQGISDWLTLINRYKNNAYVCGADLKNKPHGNMTTGMRPPATWGYDEPGQGTTDWKAAAERIGTAILNANPNMIIIVEGVECYYNYPTDTVTNFFWWGGELSGVADHPITAIPSAQLMYSVHEYGPEVYNQSWFQDSTFPNNMPAIWDKHYYFIKKNGIGSLFFGEFGITESAVEAGGVAATWYKNFMAYIGTANSWTFWCINPDSGDTGGILQNNWVTVEPSKYAVLKPYLAAQFSPLGGASSSSSSTVSSVAASSSRAASSVAVSSSRSSAASSVAASSSRAASSVASSIAASSRSSVASSAAVSSSRSSAASSAAASSTAASSGGGYAVNYTVNNDWGAGATCTVTVKNNSATAVNGWSLVWTYAGNQTLTQIWNATYTASGETITVTNASFNNVISVNGGTQSFGFNLSYSGSNAKPASFTLNGTACTTY